MAKISVILPCYNVEKLIDRCLESIVKQTMGVESFEIICVDDCSTDNTWDKLLEWEHKYPDQFILVKSDENGRQGKARNIGMLYAGTDWIGFIDSDDWIEPDYFEKMYEKAIAGNYDVVTCGNKRDFSKEYTLFSEEEKHMAGENEEIIIASEEIRKKLIRMPAFGYSAWAKLIKKSFLIENELLFPELITYEDAVWGSIMHLYVKSGYNIKEKLYHYFVNESSTVLTSNSNHHLDCILSQDMLWDEWKRRGFLEKYYDELTIEHIYSGFLAGLKASILRYDEPDYNYYLLLRHLSIKKIPDFKSNKYINSQEFPEVYRIMLTALENTLSKPQFKEFAKSIKKINF